MEILRYYDVDPAGKKGHSRMGRSLVIGRPVAMMAMPGRSDRYHMSQRYRN